MKRAVFFTALFIAVHIVQAQQSLKLIEGQSSLVYSLPKTELLVDVQIEKTVQKPGQYYQYSQRYLAESNIVMEGKSTFRIKSVKLRTASVVDLARTFIVPESKYLVLKQLTLNSKGLLCGINTDFVEAQSSKQQNKKPKLAKSVENSLLPLGEEYMMAGSTAKLAEGAAKQIYRIRESRMSLLTGDLEHLPDGVSLKTMLKELNKMEASLTELFVGKTETEIITHTVRFIPTEIVDKMILFRVSALKGLVENNDLSGVPYFISMQTQKIESVVPSSKAKAEKVAIYTIIPAVTRVNISDGLNNTLVSKDLPIPQFGILVPLSEDMFKDQNISVKIDPNTGRMLQIKSN